jgi:hypothetical protein
MMTKKWRSVKGGNGTPEMFRVQRKSRFINLFRRCIKIDPIPNPHLSILLPIQE